MFSRLRAALLFSLLLAGFFFTDADADIIKKVTWSVLTIFDKEMGRDPSFLKNGAVFSDFLADVEISRLDSLYFSIGRLSARISVDTLQRDSGIDLDIIIVEGEQTRIGEIRISGDKSLLTAESGGLNRLRIGDPFSPEGLKVLMRNSLDLYNNSGYPFAQIWLTAFRFEEKENKVDISFSIVSGEEALLSGIIFDGLTRTDSSVAVMASRVDIPKKFSEEIIENAAKNLEASGLFKAVGKERINRNGEGKVVLVFPVEEKKSSNYFQGAFGFSRKDNNDYEMNGRVDIQLDNIAGTGRKAGYFWLNDGRKYSKTKIEYHEPFLFSKPVAVSFSVEQVVEDSLYNMHSGLIELKFPFGPWGFNSLIGFSGDRNVIPSGGELSRSVRQRYRVGLEKGSGSVFRANCRIEGGRRKNYPRDGGTQIDWQYLYSFNLFLTIPTIENQNLFCRMVSEGIFSDGNIHIAEMFPMGGAKTLRGFRENQFRGERVSYLNLEYRFGGQNRIFLFNDTGGYYREGQKWKFKNGFGFGIRSVSDLGIVELSFGTAGRLSMDEARIHISLTETF
jgi:outer membrane protein assembly factor BamA